MALAVGLNLVGCGGSPPPAEETTPQPAAEPSPAPAEPEAADAPEPAAPSTPKGPSTVDNNTDYEIGERDCRALAAAYAESWRLDELAKVPAGMSPSERTEVENELDGSSKEMREQYLGQCRNTIGTAYPYDNLKCAMKAKSMKRFDDCMAGKL